MLSYMQLQLADWMTGPMHDKIDHLVCPLAFSLYT